LGIQDLKKEALEQMMKKLKERIGDKQEFTRDEVLNMMEQTYRGFINYGDDRS